MAGIMTTIVSCLEQYKLDITAVTIFYSGREKHERGVGYSAQYCEI